VIHRRISRREAATVLLQAFSNQRPTIIPRDDHFTVRMPSSVWLQVVEAFTPLAEPLEANAASHPRRRQDD
jgi:hypothetical protein